MRLVSETRFIETKAGNMKVVILRPRIQTEPLPGVLWIHGGGYYEGVPEMVHFSRIRDAAKQFGAVVVSPDYRLSNDAPYPAALDDCYDTLLWLKDNAYSLGVDRDRIMVGGESAGGGLTAAICMLAHDRGEVDIFCQFPIYPMLDCYDTESSRDNNSLGWNTKRNHEAWRKYLGPIADNDEIPEYASPSRRKNYEGLPPCYTFVADGEPFYIETLEYVRKLNEAGVNAVVDVFHADIHAFDVIFPLSKAAKDAKASFLEHYRMMVGIDDSL